MGATSDCTRCAELIACGRCLHPQLAFLLQDRSLESGRASAAFTRGSGHVSGPVFMAGRPPPSVPPIPNVQPPSHDYPTIPM